MKTTIMLTVIHHGDVIARETQAIDLAEDAAEQIVVPIPPPSPFSTFEDGVARMRQRDLRRTELRRVSSLLCEAMADHLEDKAGWHGEDRRKGMAEYPDRARLEKELADQ